MSRPVERTGEQPRTALRIDGDARAAIDDRVVDEVPVALSYNGVPHAVMMATPADLADFALGFSLTERIVADAREFVLVDQLERGVGIVLEIAIPATRFVTLDARRRALAGRTGCGLCGVESLQQAVLPPVRVDDATPRDVAALRDAVARIASHQPLNAVTGGVHAAGFVTASSVTVREDVGRHNALDKLAGALARGTAMPTGDGVVVVTSRASYEMVHKAATIGVGVLVAMSAPTALAIAHADAANLTLVAFARGQTMNVYTHAWRVT